MAYQARRRAGTASTKTKANVAGTGAKPWKQKGLGRARAGYKQSPIWRGGGVAFGPHPRSYDKGLNRKAARLAFRRAFSDKVASGAVEIIEDFTLSEPKTRAFVAVLNQLKVEGHTLIVLDTIDTNMAKASRNVPGIEVVTSHHLNAYELVRYPRIIISRAAMGPLQERLAAGQGKSES